jgi:hypothetical protein
LRFWLFYRDLTRLEVVQKNGQSFRLLTIILHDNTTRSNNLSSISLSIKNTKTRPFSKLLSIGNLDEIDVVFGTESLNELGIRLWIARLGKHSEMSLATIQLESNLRVFEGKRIPVKGLCAFPETPSESIVHKCAFEDLTKGILDGHARFGGVSRNFDLFGLRSSITF